MKVERWYDRNTRSWVIQLLDDQGNQVGNAVYVGNKHDALYEENLMKKELEAIRLWFVTINYMGMERDITIEASSPEEARSKFKKAFPHYKRIIGVREQLL